MEEEALHLIQEEQDKILLQHNEQPTADNDLIV